MKKLIRLLPFILMLLVNGIVSVNTSFANSTDTANTETTVQFPVGTTAYIVDKPTSELQKRI